MVEKQWWKSNGGKAMVEKQWCMSTLLAPHPQSVGRGRAFAEGGTGADASHSGGHGGSDPTSMHSCTKFRQAKGASFVHNSTSMSPMFVVMTTLPEVGGRFCIASSR